MKPVAQVACGNSAPRCSRSDWNDSKPMWVIGTIDAYGAITARASKMNGMDSPMHTAGDGSGHRWRWNVWGQEYHPVLGKQDLTDEEVAAVTDWLDRHGFIFPSNQKLTLDANSTSVRSEETP